MTLPSGCREVCRSVLGGVRYRGPCGHRLKQPVSGLGGDESGTRFRLPVATKPRPLLAIGIRRTHFAIPCMSTCNRRTAELLRYHLCRDV